MKTPRIILALVAVVSMASSAMAQDNGAIGGICQIGVDCPTDHQGGNGGIDPSPYDPQPGYPHHPNPPDYPGDHGYGSDRREIFVGRYLRDESLNLLSLAGLSPWNDRGTRIESVDVILQDNGRASLQLIADGFIVASNHYPSGFTTLFPQQTLVLGESLRSRLELGVRGKMFIDRVIINISDDGGVDPGPGPGGDVVLNGSIYQNFYGPGNLDLTRVTQLMAYRGYQIASITVNGRSLSQYQGGRARLMINGMVEGDLFFDLYDRGQTVYPRGSYVVGRNLNSLTLLIDGQVAVNTVQIRLVRF